MTNDSPAIFGVPNDQENSYGANNHNHVKQQHSTVRNATEYFFINQITKILSINPPPPSKPTFKSMNLFY